jgi:hypothetical protein
VREAAAAVQLDVSCPGIDDGGRVFVRVAYVSGAESCDEYRLDWGDD